MDQTGIYGTFHPNTEEDIFSAIHGAFLQTDPYYNTKQVSLNLGKLK